MSAIKENKDYLLSLIGILLLTVTLWFVFARDGNGLNDIPGKLDDVVDSLNRGPKTYSKPPEMEIDVNKDYKAIIKTNKGDITIDLFERSAPKTVNNFVFLAEDNFYNGTIFHRVVRDFVIQGGDRNNRDGTGGPGYTFEDEINWDSIGLTRDQQEQLTKEGFHSTPGLQSVIMKSRMVAMANSGPDTNGSQFFIVSGPDSSVAHLNGRHTVFGKVVDGWNVVQEIQNVEVDSNGKPLNDIVIKSIDIDVE